MVVGQIGCMRYENLKIAMDLSIIVAITEHFVAEVRAPHQDGVIMSILRVKVSRDRRRGDGQRQVHRRHGRLRPLARGHDSALWERPMTTSSRPLLIPRSLRTSEWMRRPRRFWWKTSIES